jgi:hypothetical protein
MTKFYDLAATLCRIAAVVFAALAFLSSPAVSLADENDECEKECADLLDPDECLATCQSSGAKCYSEFGCDEKGLCQARYPMCKDMCKNSKMPKSCETCYCKKNTMAGICGCKNTP